MDQSRHAIGISVMSSAAAQKSYIALLKSLHRGEKRQVASVILSRKINFAEWSNYLVTERLGVNVHSLVLDLGIQALFPRDFLARIEDQHQRQQRRNVILMQCLREIHSAFGRADIDFLLLKGLHVAEFAWNGKSSRFTWDLDLLIRQESWATAVNALRNLGFRKPRSLGFDRIIHYVTHAMPMHRGGDEFLDLHWTFRKLPGVRLDLRQIWNESRAFQIDGLDCGVPCNEHLLLLMLLGIADDKNRSKINMRSIWDIYLLLQKMNLVDWSSFLNNRRPEGLLPLMANSLNLVLERLDCRDEFPELDRALRDCGDILGSHGRPDAYGLPQRWQAILSGKWWFARLQPEPLWYYGLWWLATLPVRYLLTRSR